jgi:asparagine synthase (glutamine-hydrolysing)
MCDVMVHRGPDGEGYYTNHNITLGHCRLSIIDLKTGNQPIYNEDGSIVVVYNGEIYNFRKLRTELEKCGHQFTTSSDTEVIVHAYEEYGFDCVKFFNGMFAFAIYNANKDEIFLARDRCGIKPLHYTMLEDGTFLFASEIKAILQYKRVKREMDPNSLHLLINLRYIPGNRTMFKGIQRLLPGHVMVIKNHSIKIKQFWKPAFVHTTHPESYYVKMLQKLLDAAVERHLISDVPVGLMLSGGIDSSSLVALASKKMDEPLKTFCMGFGNSNDEIHDAQFVADYFGTDHHQLIVDAHLLKDYPKMIWYADEPKRNLYPYYISEMIGKNVKTALGGLGSDELFGGYVFKYHFIQGIENIRKKTTTNTKKEISKIADTLISFQTWYGNIVEDEHLDYLEMIRAINDRTDLYLITQTQDKVFDWEYLKKVYGDSLLKEELVSIKDIYSKFFKTHHTSLEQLMIADFSYKMTDDFLLVDDRMAMAHSLESRVPFLDNLVVDFAFGIPVELKIRDPNGKYILKKAMKDILPKQVIEKKKQGFASGTYEVYLKEGREMMQQMLPDGNLVKQGYIQKGYVEKILDAVPNPRLDLHYGAMWNLLTCEIWHRIFIENDNPVMVSSLDNIT